MPNENNNPKRGDIYFVRALENDPAIGSEVWSDRYAVIVSNRALNNTSNCVEIVYLSTSLHNKPSPLYIPIKSSGSKKRAMALCSQIYTVDKSRLGKYIGKLTPNERRDLNGALALSIGLKEDTNSSLFTKWEKYIKQYNIPVVNELNSYMDAKHDETIERLTAECATARQERDGYRAIAEALQKRLDEFQSKIEPSGSGKLESKTDELVTKLLNEVA